MSAAGRSRWTGVAGLLLILFGIGTPRAAEPSAPRQPGPDEVAAAKAVRAAYARARQPAPIEDPALDAAARQLAAAGLASGPRASTDSNRVAAALDKAGAWDPPPRVIGVRATPASNAANLIEQRRDLAAQPATHFGVGLARSKEDTAAAVLLFVTRKVELEPFARLVDVGAQQRLAGKLAYPLRQARVVVTGPSGKVREPAMEQSDGRAFYVDLRFSQPGRYTVEIEAQGPQGPEVAALFHVQSGAPERGAGNAGEREEQVQPERRDLNKAEAQVVAAINQKRRARGLPALARSATLDAAAAQHAGEMVRLNYFAHVSPTGGDVAKRLTRLGFRYARVSENLGEAASALEAHRAIEASPGHLENVVDPNVDLVGVAAVPVRRGSIDNVIVVEVFARAE